KQFMLFFFTSRRRHTSFSRDWSSDVCSSDLRLEAQQWERRIRTEGLVLCYDRDRPEGWYYRLRLPSDGRLVIDWPEGLPFPDERFKRALELPYEGADDVI